MVQSVELSTKESEAIAFQEMPLTALSKNTLRKLSQLLNSKKILRSEEGYERDWRGLASLVKQKFDYLASDEDPTTKVIQLWCTNNPKTATFTYLEKFLGIIDRWDVCDDIYENLVEDSKVYQEKQQSAINVKPDDCVDTNTANLQYDFGHGSDSNILTMSDVIRAQKGLPPQMYDAFVLYADADLNYASEILTKLEDNPDYSFKLCMKDRDLLAGVQFEHVALTQLIEERCKHLIVILTEEFLKSPENKFLVNYTQALQIQHKTRKIVPLLYEDSVNIPRTLKIYTHLRYNSGKATLFNFWSKLANSIQNVNVTTDLKTASPSSYLSGTNSTTASSSSISNDTRALPNPSTVIPSISVVPPAENEVPKKKERSKLKSLTIRNQKRSADNVVLRSAHSTGQLHTSHESNNAFSISDLSTTSFCSDAKKKQKWSSKILKKVFSRSSSKLQEA